MMDNSLPVNISQTQNLIPEDASASLYFEGWNDLEPLKEIDDSTLFHGTNFVDSTAITSEEHDLQNQFEPPVVKPTFFVIEDSTPMQIWEGTVLDVDLNTEVMQVALQAKIGNVPQHTGEIDLEWVSEQDQGLLKPGAVFYLTLFKRTKRGGSIENSQELRFRRRPSWSTAQLQQIEKDAEMLQSKMKPLPTVE